jgi:hypothetical protein
LRDAWYPRCALMPAQTNCRITVRELSFSKCTIAPMSRPSRHKPMSSLDLDLDTQMSNLEIEWRQGYEASIAARADYQKLAANPNAKADMLDAARERLDRAEAQKARIMTRIERLEDAMLGAD